MKTANEIIQERIDQLEKEINGWENSEQSFIQDKYIRSLYSLVKELKSLQARINEQSA